MADPSPSFIGFHFLNCPDPGLELAKYKNSSRIRIRFEMEKMADKTDVADISKMAEKVDVADVADLFHC